MLKDLLITKKEAKKLKPVRLQMRQIGGYKKGEKFSVDKIITREKAGKIIDYLMSP